MAVSVGSVEVLLTLRDALSAALAKPSANLVKLSGEVRRVESELLKHAKAAEAAGRAHERSGSAIDKFGKQVRTTLVHVAAAATAYKALAAAAKSVTDVVELVRTFEKIENVTGVTREEVDKLRASLNQLSTSTGKGPQELADGFYSIASAGVRGAEATEILTASARASAVGLGETKDIARSITAAINAYGKENLSAAKAADILFATVREGGAEASEVAGVFGRVVGIASQLGVSFDQVGSFIATFTRLGVGADEAVTALRGSLTAMLTPTRNQEEALKAVGMSMDSLRQSVREKGLTAALIELTRASQGNEDIIGAVIPNVRSLAGVLGVAGKQAEAYIDVTNKITGSTGDLARAFDDVSKSASFQWDQLKAQFQQLAIALGQQLLPGVLAFRKALASMDVGELGQLGSDAATVLKLLAEIVKLVVNNLAELKALVIGLVGLRLVESLGKWVHGLGQVKVATEAAASSTAGLADKTRLYGNIAIVAFAAALLAVDKLKEGIRRNQAEIERMVANSDRVGAAQRKLFEVRQGGTVTLSEFEQMKKDAREAQAVLEELGKRRDKLAADQANNARGLQHIHDKEIELLNTEMRAEIARRDALTATTWAAFNNQRVVADIADKWEEVGNNIKIPNAAAEAFSQRTSEILSKLRDQLDASKAELELARARRDEGDEAVRGARQLSVEARAQLEITKVLNSLESSKHRLSAATRAEIAKLVTEWVRVKDEVKSVNAEVALQEKLQRSQERAYAQMLRIAEQRATAERKIHDELNAQVEALQDEFAAAAIDLETRKKMLAALLSGGREAARAAELQGEFEKQHINNARELATWLANIESQQERINYLIAKVGELAKPAWQIYLDAAFDAINAIGDALSDVITQAALEGKVNWESVWESLKSSLIKIFADMLADMLKRWIATQLAMAAASKSINAGAGAAGGAGGGGGTGGAISGALGGAQSSGASMGTIAQWAVAAFAVYVFYKAVIEDHKAKFASATIGPTGDVVSRSSYGTKYLAGLSTAVSEIGKGLANFLSTINVQMQSLAQVTIFHDKGGFGVNGQLYKSMEEAIDAAVAFQIKYGEFADSVSTMVRAAIRNTKGTTAAIASNVEFARLLETQNLDPIARDMQAAFDVFKAQIMRSFELFRSDLPALLQATSSSITLFSSSLTSLYNNLMGIKEDPKAEWERQKAAYNAQRAIIIAQMTLLYEEIKARIALYRVQALNTAGFNSEAGDGGRWGGGERPGGDGGGGSDGRSEDPFAKGGGVYREDPRNPSNDPQLAQLLQILDNLARALQGLPPEITGDKPGRRRRDGGRRGALDSLRESIATVDRSFATRNMEEFGRRLVEINHKWDEAAKEAGKNKEALDGVARARREEIQMLQEEAQQKYAPYLSQFGMSDFAKGIGSFLGDLNKVPDEILPAWQREIVRTNYLTEQLASVGDRIRSFSGDFFPTAQIDEVRATAEKLRADLATLAAQGVDTTAQLAAVAAAEKYRLEQIELGIGRELFGYLKDAPEFAARALEFARMELDAKFEGLRLQLVALGVWEKWADVWAAASDAAKKALEDAGKIPEETEPIVRNMQAANDNAEGIRDALAEALRRLKEWTESLLLDQQLTTLSPAQQEAEARKQLMEAFGTAKLTRTSESIDRFMEVAKQTLQTFRTNEASGPLYQQIFQLVLDMSRMLQGIPMLQEGGIVTRPQLAFVHPNEAVIPLTELSHMLPNSDDNSNLVMLDQVRANRRQQGKENMELYLAIERNTDEVRRLRFAVNDRDRTRKLRNAVGAGD